LLDRVIGVEATVFEEQTGAVAFGPEGPGDRGVQLAGMGRVGPGIGQDGFRLDVQDLALDEFAEPTAGLGWRRRKVKVWPTTGLKSVGMNPLPNDALRRVCDQAAMPRSAPERP
jgi:hypothetical protein